MALVVADKVKVRSYGIGTGEFQLETVFPGFQSFAAIGDGNETYYGIEDSAGNWEVGRGTYSTDSTAEYLYRDSVLSSSNNNNLVNFPDGGKTVFCTIPSSVLNSIVSGSVVDSFKTIAVSGQSNVVADSATDTLTLVAGTGITLTTDAGTDSITVSASIDGVTQNSQVRTVCPAGVDTVIYTASAQFQHGIKLFVLAEGIEDGGGALWESQACDIIATRGYNNDIVHLTAYGITYSGLAAFATFDSRWNVTSGRIEITCRPVSLTNNVTVTAYAFELASND